MAARASLGIDVVPTVTTPSRALNASYIAHATRPVLALYTVTITAITTLLSGDDGSIQLKSDKGVPTTIRAEARNQLLQTLGVTVGTQTMLGQQLVFIIPAGWTTILSTVVFVAAPLFAITRQTEIVL